MIRALVGLGANLGDAHGNLCRARAALDDSEDLAVAAASAIYRSAAIGPAAQPDYLNAVLAVDTEQPAIALLDTLQRLEARAGRLRATEERWGPRPLDLDLLLYGNLSIATERLQVPHPRLYERNFVLLPLADLYPDHWRFPDGSSLRDRRRACPGSPIERTGLGWHTAGLTR